MLREPLAGADAAATALGEEKADDHAEATDHAWDEGEEHGTMDDQWKGCTVAIGVNGKHYGKAEGETAGETETTE